MRMYEVKIFNGIDEAKSFNEVNCFQCKYIAKESDLESLKEKGGGFRILRYIGELYMPDNDSINNLTVNISCNLVGKEEVENTIKELENNLRKLKVGFII